MNEIRRARPWLGTIVDVRVGGLGEGPALAAIESAFAAVEEVHRAMSFHDEASELSRMNRRAVIEWVPISDATRAVVELALEIARVSGGRFDPTIAGDLVARELLPAPSRERPGPRASWRDVQLDGDRIRYARPLWLDLGGIAKGWAVDAAIDALRARGVRSACVNAGGDLRVTGEAIEVVCVRDEHAIAPALELREGSVATSAGHRTRQRRGRAWIGPHVDGRSGRVVGVRSTVSVIAERCAVADALTKIVLADRRFARHLLPRYGAAALVRGRDGAWRTLSS